MSQPVIWAFIGTIFVLIGVAISVVIYMHIMDLRNQRHILELTSMHLETMQHITTMFEESAKTKVAILATAVPAPYEGEAASLIAEAKKL